MKVNTIFLLAIILLLNACTEKPKKIDLNPNFIIIMADDLGYGDLSSYGNQYIQTPNIDNLAKEGIKFTDFHSNGSVCSPTRAALMTGNYQQRSGVSGVITALNHRDVGLGLEQVTIAEELKKQGYNCGMFGKWHLGYPKEYNPTLQGFDEFVGFVSGNVDFHAHIDQEGYLDWWKGNKIDNEKGYTTDLITRYGVEYIKKNNSKKTNKPFFLYLPHEAPHGPYQRRIDRVLRKVGKAGTKSVNKDSIPGIYKEMVEVMDEGIGKIIKTLKETNQIDNTIIVFLSDNGANRFGSNGVLKGYKGGAYEGGSRVPAIISYPNKIKKGLVNNQTILGMDLFPTILDFINKKPSNKIDGISLKNLLVEQKKLPQRDVFYSFKNFSFIRSGNWKLIKNSKNNKLQLFNLQDDLSEANDISKDNPELVKNLSLKLTNWEIEVSDGVQVVSN